MVQEPEAKGSQTDLLQPALHNDNLRYFAPPGQGQADSAERSDVHNEQHTWPDVGCRLLRAAETQQTHEHTGYEACHACASYAALLLLLGHNLGPKKGCNELE